MIGLIQRVSHASVAVAGNEIAAIGNGLVVLIGVERDDAAQQAERLAERLLNYRVFEDADGRMNLDVTQAGGEVLLVPQFTLAADTQKGNRPGFSGAAAPETGEKLFNHLVASMSGRWDRVQTGQFGANMDVALSNRGPVTFWLQVPPS